MSIRPQTLILVVLAAAAGYGLSAWAGSPTSTTRAGIPTTPDLSGPAPRDASGKPDLSGVWIGAPMTRADATAINPMTDIGSQALGEPVPPRQFMNALWDYRPEEITMTPDAAALFERRFYSRGRDVPSSFCLPLGVPMTDAAPYPHKIVHTPGLMVILYDELSIFRQIFTDGRPLPTDADPAFLGHSIGRWDGDVMVIDAIGFRDHGWLDAYGHPHSAEMRVTERLFRRDFGHMEVEVTVTDLATYNKPFTYRFVKDLQPDHELIESVCEHDDTRARLDAIK